MCKDRYAGWTSEQHAAEALRLSRKASHTFGLIRPKRTKLRAEAQLHATLAVASPGRAEAAVIVVDNVTPRGAVGWSRDMVGVALVAGVIAVAGLLAPAVTDARSKPDLVAVPPPAPEGSMLAGRKVTVTVGVANRGGRPVGRSLGEVVLSADARRDAGDVVVGRVFLRPVAPGGQGRARVRVRLPRDTGAGAYRLILCADAGRAVAEASERNNCSATRRMRVTSLVLVRECGDAPLPTGGPAEGFTAMWDRSGAGWTGGDGAFSVPLPDGRIAWMFADSFIGGIAGGRRRNDSPLVNNTIVVQNGACLTTAVGGMRENPQALVAPDKYYGWYWPASGFVQDGELRIVYYHLVRDGPDDKLGHSIGTDLARFALPDLRLLGVERLVGEGNPAWGGATVDAGAYTYLFGVKVTGMTWRLHVARTERGRLGDAPLEYWDGTGWDPDPGHSQPVADDVTTLSFLVDDRGWTLVTQPPLYDDAITVRQAPAPEGPWGAENVIARATSPDDGYTYGAAIHPEFGGDRSSMLLSYSHIARGWDGLFVSADIYRPRFVRVDLGAVDAKPAQARYERNIANNDRRARFVTRPPRRRAPRSQTRTPTR
jgi:CARDB